MKGQVWQPANKIFPVKGDRNSSCLKCILDIYLLLLVGTFFLFAQKAGQ